MKTNHYSKVRFIGYAIPTGQSVEQLIFSGYLYGEYLAAADFATDIRARVAILKNAVDTAKKALPSDEDPRSVNNVFMAPEGYFYGALGPYVYKPGEPDPADVILKLLLETFNADDYPNWTFVFGTVMSAEVADIDAVFRSRAVKARKKMVRDLVESGNVQFGNAYAVTKQILGYMVMDLRNNPAVQVRDRALIVSHLGFDVPQELPGSGDAPDKKSHTKCLTSEKYFLSNMDFLLIEDGDRDVVTQEMVAYPHIDLSGGDVKKTAKDPYAIFRQDYGRDNVPRHVVMGVEICLDHDDDRLRMNMHREAIDKKPVVMHLQLVPTYGSQISLEAIAAGRNGFVFSCDGWCPLNDRTGPHQGILRGVQCVYVNYFSVEETQKYCAHSQLARVQRPAKGDDPNLSSAKLHVLSPEVVSSIEVDVSHIPDVDFADFFSGGPGAIHIYGLDEPYAL